MGMEHVFSKLTGIKGAIFDVDGTILDSMAVWEESDRRYLRSCGCTPEEHLSEKMFAFTMQEGIRYLQKTYKLQRTLEEIEQGILEVVTDFYAHEAKMKKGIPELLEFLYQQGTLMTVATSSERHLVEAAFRHLNIEKYFKDIFICTEVGAGKSEPLVFLEAARSMQMKPEEIYVFEDGLYAIETAQNAGFQIVGIYDESSKKDQKEIKDFSDLYIRL